MGRRQREGGSGPDAETLVTLLGGLPVADRREGVRGDGAPVTTGSRRPVTRKTREHAVVTTSGTVK